VTEQAARGNRAVSQGQVACVVGEKEDLNALGELAQNAQGRRGPLIVEMNQYVVQHQGQGWVALEVALEAGDAQSQIQLVARAFAQTVDRHFLAILAQGNELPFLDAHTQAPEAAQSEPRKRASAPDLDSARGSVQPRVGARRKTA